MPLFDSLSTIDLPKFRKEQILLAWFDPKITCWEAVTTLSKELRKQLTAKIPWISLSAVSVQESPTAYKALLNLSDGKKIESVLMMNSKGYYTACISSQIGCAMACDFCATGTMGFIRDLTVDEIVDQVRFWRIFLREKRLSNLVFMGMGEPLNNYESVRESINYLIQYSNLGKTHITLSTVGVKQGMEKILVDPLWPDVRIAISLHYPIQEKRRLHMPVAKQRSLSELKDWCIRYLHRFGNRRHDITFEYLMLEGKNDSAEDIRALKDFFIGIDRYKMNLIPWNEVPHLPYSRSSREKTEAFQKKLSQAGIFSTIRKSLGREIDAGCGQLAILDHGGRRRN